jgi:hypothetical protein
MLTMSTSSRFPRYLNHLCGTTWRDAYGFAVPQCNLN